MPFGDGTGPWWASGMSGGMGRGRQWQSRMTVSPFCRGYRYWRMAPRRPAFYGEGWNLRPEDEVEYLNEVANSLEADLKDIKQRIEEIRAKK